MSAKVGLLTRNIRIEGANEPVGSLEDQSFGCSVLVSKYTENGLTYKGRAQFDEVQFSHCGKLGYDPRYFIAATSTIILTALLIIAHNSKN